MTGSRTSAPVVNRRQAKARSALRSLSLLTPFALIPIARRAERNYQAVPALPQTLSCLELPSLSIVVPVRDEAANLPGLLHSLCNLHYSGILEIIVVDDGSVDGSDGIARDFPVRLLQISSLPPGWTGKTYACHRGAEIAAGEWLLFVDADTRHHPQGPARAVSYALAHNLHGLSLFLPNATSGIADRLALMVAFASFFAASRPDAAVLNGQYILLHRDAYHQSGGFRAVRRQVTEDLALGRLLQRQGFHVPIIRGESAGVVHMYRHPSQLWLGLSRYAVASLRWTGFQGIWAMLLTILLAAPLELLLAALVAGAVRPALFSWFVSSMTMFGWASRFGGRAWALLAPLGAMQVQLAALWGIARRIRGRGVRWKGRDL